MEWTGQIASQKCYIVIQTIVFWQKISDKFDSFHTSEPIEFFLSLVVAPMGRMRPWGKIDKKGTYGNENLATYFWYFGNFDEKRTYENMLWAGHRTKKIKIKNGMNRTNRFAKILFHKFENFHTSEPIEFFLSLVVAPMGRLRPWGTLSPMTSTHSQGKKPTSKPRFPRHHIDSSGGGISITEIMSPTCKNK